MNGSGRDWNSKWTSTAAPAPRPAAGLNGARHGMSCRRARRSSATCSAGSRSRRPRSRSSTQCSPSSRSRSATMRGWENSRLFAGSPCEPGARGGVVGDAMRGSLRRPRWPREWQGAENRVRNRPSALCEERPRAAAANRHVIRQRTASRCRPRPPAGGRARPRSWRRNAARPAGADARALLPVPSAGPLPVPSAGPLPAPCAGPR